MKLKLFTLFFIGFFIISACAPAAPVAEEVEEEIIEKASMPAVSEEAAEVESSEEENPEPEMNESVVVSFSQDVWPIIEQYALNAHGGKGGVFLESYSDILENVEPGDPEGSLVFRALIGDGMKQMPPGNPLPDASIQLIYDWIKQGAKDN